MEKSLFQLALDDLDYVIGKWKKDRKWIFETYPDLDKSLYFNHNAAFWDLFTIEQIAKIYLHYKKSGVLINPKIDLSGYLSRRPILKGEFYKLTNLSFKIYYSILDKNSVLTLISEKQFTSIPQIDAQQSALKRAGFWDHEIEALLKGKKESLRKVNNRSARGNTLVCKAKREALRPKEALMTNISKGRLASVYRKMTEKWGVDESKIYRRILMKAHKGTIKLTDFCTVDDSIFEELLAFLELKNYAECLQLLPCLAQFLNRRNGAFFELSKPVPSIDAQPTQQ